MAYYYLIFYIFTLYIDDKGFIINLKDYFFIVFAKITIRKGYLHSQNVLV